MSSQFGMKDYMKGALLLTIAAFLVKVLSAIYRVPFQNLVGDQGFYIYQQVYPFISFFVVWTSSGFAVAISKMLADENNENEKYFIAKTIFQYLTILSLLFFSILFFGAEFISSYMEDIELTPLLKVGAFVTLFMPSIAIMKGVFQSRGQMAPVAYAQVTEQFIRVSVILIGTIIFINTSQSLYTVGTTAIFGTVVGELAGAFLLFIFIKKNYTPFYDKTTKKKKWTIIKKVTIFSISVSMSSLLLLSYQLIDSFTIYSGLLQLGIDDVQAKEMKGVYDRGLPLVQFGMTIASSLALSIVPLIAHHAKKQNVNRETSFIQLTYRVTLVFSVAQAIGLVIIMPYANVMLFKTDEFSNVLQMIALQIIPISIVLTFTAILQGFGKLLVPFLILIFSIGLKLCGNLFLIKPLGVLGAALSSDIALVICALFLIYYLKQYKEIQLTKYSFYIKIIAACFMMVIAVMGSDMLLSLFPFNLSNRIHSIFLGGCLIFIGAVTFIMVVMKTRVLEEKEWFLLPFGRRLASLQLLLNRKKVGECNE